jgi:hypothetical protein
MASFHKPVQFIPQTLEDKMIRIILREEENQEERLRRRMYDLVFSGN